MTLADMWKLLQAGGLPVGLFLVIVASWRGDYIWRRDHDRIVSALERERDGWRDAYLRTIANTDALIKELSRRGDGA